MAVTVKRLRRLAARHGINLPSKLLNPMTRLLQAHGMDVREASVRTKQRFVNDPNSQVLEFRQTWRRAKFCQETRYVTVDPDYFSKGWPAPSVLNYEVHLPHDTPLKPVRIRLR